MVRTMKKDTIKLMRFQARITKENQEAIPTSADLETKIKTDQVKKLKMLFALVSGCLNLWSAWADNWINRIPEQTVKQQAFRNV